MLRVYNILFIDMPIGLQNVYMLYAFPNSRGTEIETARVLNPSYNIVVSI